MKNLTDFGHSVFVWRMAITFPTPRRSQIPLSHKEASLTRVRLMGVWNLPLADFCGSGSGRL